MIYLTNEEELKFDQELIVIYFYSSWLLFHKKMTIMIDKLEKSNSYFKFYAVDVDYFKPLCKRFNVSSIPTTIIFDNTAKELKKIVGLPLTSAFKKAFADIYKLHLLQKKENFNEE